MAQETQVNKKTLLTYIIEAIVFIAIIAGVWGYFSNKLNVSDQNIKALKGSLQVVELQNKNLLYSRDSYVATINDLEELLRISKKEAKDIQRQLDSKIAYIAKLEQSVKIEYVEVIKDSIIYVDNSKDHLIAPFHYQDDWLSLNGENEFHLGENFDYKTTLKDIKMNTPLTVGLTNDYQIFVTTPNPYVSFSSIEGAVIDKSIVRPRKKRFGWGLQVGVGAMYDVLDKDIAVGPYGGLGVHVNF